LIAGLILSSLPPDRISNSPHHNIKTIESIHAKSTNNEIDNSMKSQNSIASQNNGL
jgi:hypothetical protein